MLTIIAGFGHNEDEHGEKCLRWVGLPTVEEVRRAMTKPDDATLVRIETLVSLPRERINVYKQGDMEGSYDGEMLRVVCDYWGRQQGIHDVYKALRSFYLGIAHGQVAGEYRVGA
jgi:hypothetical protein